MNSDGVKRQMSLNVKNYGQWLQIQRNTFTNWVNEGLRGRSIVIQDLRTDWSDGVNLVALVEALTRQSISGAVLRPSNQYEKLQNITVALDAIKKDGVKIVNIDSSDILACNLKLVLALVWQLVLKYQVGLSATQHKAWILLWLRAVIPDCSITNFTTDWNDGIALHALLDFCKPGLSPNWRQMDRSKRLENCQSAMKLARQHFNIPLILRPEDLASSQLDEKSAITYLSYFIRVGGPGYDATLQRVSARTLPKTVSNFTTDWQNGKAVINLVRSAGGQVIGGPNVDGTPVQLIELALDAGRQIGVDPILSPEEITKETSEHLGMMTYSSQYLRYPNHIPYDTRERPVIITNNNNNNNNDIDFYNPYRSSGKNYSSYRSSTYSSKRTSNYNHSPRLSHKSNLNINNNDYHNTSSNHVSYLDQSDRHLSVSNTNLNRPHHYSVHLNTPLRVSTSYDDDASSAHTSTITSNPPTSPPTFHLVRRSSMHAPRIEVPNVDQLKVDIYSVGVIMESKMSGGAFDPEKFVVEAVSPTGRVIKINGDGGYSADFAPDEIGRWKVSMYYEGRYMDGCPIDVCDPSQVKIYDLKGGHAGKHNTFHVDCTKAGPGDLGVDITHQGRPVVTHISHTQTSGYYKVTFTPYEAGAYEINVHFNRAEVREGDIEFFNPDDRKRKAVFKTRVEPKHGHVEVKSSCDWEVDYVTGWPFICHVTDSRDVLVYGMEDGTVCAHPTMLADCTKVGDGIIDAEVTYKGVRYPCKIRREKPMIYRVSFRPRGSGTYKVWINYNGQPVKGSPFIQEIAELEKPTCDGDGLYKGVPLKPSTFIVDPRGFPGQVSVGVTGPSGPVSSELEPRPDNTIKATYYPTERGPHTVHVKLDGRDIADSPYSPLIVDPVNVRMSGSWKPYLDEKGVIPLRVNKEKHLPFDVSDAGRGELTGEVYGPNGKIPVTIDAGKDGRHSVVFTPREEGNHKIHVNWGGYPLSQSPYLGIATREPELDEPDSVRLIPVPLSIRSRSPSSIRSSEPDMYRYVDEPDRGQVPSELVYHPNHPNRVQVIPVRHPEPTYMDSLSPNTLSPKSSIRSQTPNGPQKVILKGRGLKEAEVDKPAVFYVDGKKANPGVPTAHLKGVRDQFIPVKTEPMEPQLYRCTYVPKEPGAYLLYTNWNDKPLKGSPFKVNIREPAMPLKVIARHTGDPQYVYLGRDLEMKIDPREAGPGRLTVSCRDPKGREVECRLTDNHDGTRTLKVTPKMAGRHIVEILYNGGHIMGSPYAIDIKESQIKGHVRVWGPGIENGIIPHFQSNFWVETTGAGAGDLRVRIVGPKGAFHVKMRRASQKDKLYQCFYDPIEPGIYTVNVEWSGLHVEGSPFTVLLATNPRELQAMQQDFLESSSVINGDDTSVILRRSRGSNSRLGSPREANSAEMNGMLY